MWVSYRINKNQGNFFFICRNLNHRLISCSSLAFRKCESPCGLTRSLFPPLIEQTATLASILSTFHPASEIAADGESLVMLMTTGNVQRCHFDSVPYIPLTTIIHTHIQNLTNPIFQIR